jgi:large subunit ribosomal protein L28
VTFSNKHNRKWQEPNLQYKKIFWENGQRWVKLRVCTKVGVLGMCVMCWGA